MKRIGFVAHGPASANSLIPIIEGLKGSADIRLYAYHPYVADLWQCKQVEPVGYPEEFKELDIIIYGTGSGNQIELNVPVEARKLGIPSVSILDCYWANDDNLVERFKNKPTYIIVPNEDSKGQITRLSLLPEERLYVLGNPHFDRLERFKEQVLPASYPLNIVFFSQCQDTSDFSDTHVVSKEALCALVSYQKMNPDKVNQIIVAPHPREDKTWLTIFCKLAGIAIQENKSTELMLDTDINVGMSCTLQYESEIIGKPTIFFQSKEQLWKELNCIENGTVSPIQEFNATEKCIDFIKHLLEEIPLKTV